MLTAAAGRGAVCLDGSPGGYLLRAAPAGTRKWVVFHQGGGWCASPADCLARASTDLGSSLRWPDTYVDYYEGDALFRTPPFDRFNVVYALYCDGGSWAGDAEEVVNGSLVRYRGRRLLDALFDDLLRRGLQGAEEVLYAGCSAGALATYLHADYARARLPPTARVVALADAMFSLEHDDWYGEPRLSPQLRWMYSAMNMTRSVPPACRAAAGAAGGWRCLFGGYAARYVRTPLFILNSKYDTWQEWAILAVNCTIAAADGVAPRCAPAEEAFFVEYGRAMARAVGAVPARHAAFMSNCPAHCQTGRWARWGERTVNGTSIAEAVVGWYNATPAPPAAAPRHVARCDAAPCGADICCRHPPCPAS